MAESETRMDIDMAKPKIPEIRELVAIVVAYNTARTNELKVVPVPFPAGYKNPLLDNLYDAATNASAALRLATACVAVSTRPRK